MMAQNRRGPGQEGCVLPTVDGEDFYTVEEAAKVLQLRPGRIRQMLRASDLEGDTARPQDVDDAPGRELVEGLTIPVVFANALANEDVFEGVGQGVGQRLGNLRPLLPTKL
jgi:hypothetical protein